MWQTLIGALLLSFAAAAPALGGTCGAGSGSCAGDFDASLLQVVRSVPNKTDGDFSDFAGDSNNRLDKFSEKEAAAANNATGTAAAKNASAADSTNNSNGAAARKNVNATNSTSNATGAAAGKNASAANATDNATGNVTRATTAAPTTTAPACVTKKDPRIKNGWTARASPEGTPCVFGADSRDEGSHCIFEDGNYGSNGWCYTSKDKGTWGSCGGRCPLYGSNGVISSKIDGIASNVKKILGNLASKKEAAASNATGAAARKNASAANATNNATGNTTRAKKILRNLSTKK